MFFKYSVLIFPLWVYYIFCSRFTAFGYSVLFLLLNFVFFFLFAFQFWRFLLRQPQVHILSLATFSKLESPPNAFFIFVTEFLIYSTSFWFLLRISIAYIVYLFILYMMSTLSIRAMSIVIIIVLILGLIMSTFLPPLIPNYMFLAPFSRLFEYTYTCMGLFGASILFHWPMCLSLLFSNVLIY